jgi:hypothetical protein
MAAKNIPGLNDIEVVWQDLKAYQLTRKTLTASGWSSVGQATNLCLELWVGQQGLQESTGDSVPTAGHGSW